MTGRGVLIVGAGQAGLQVAVSLREEGYADPIAIVGAERHPPYQRPPLSKAYLRGETDADGLALRTPAFLQEAGIELALGTSIREIRLDPDGGGVAVDDAGRSHAFERVVLATGAEPRRLAIEGADLDGVLYLRDLDDAQRLREGWSAADRVVVIGGGFVGLEIAAVARAAGKAVTVLEAADRLVGRAVSPQTSDFLAEVHRGRGIDVRLGVVVTRIAARESSGAEPRVPTHVGAVEIAGGERIAADLVVVGIGAVPRAELAGALGIQLERGAVVVDEYALTSDPRVLAVGDVAIQPHPRGGEERVRLESVQNAVDHARTAARTIVGRPERHAVLPWFWSDQADLKLQIAGLSGDHDGVVVRHAPGTESFTALYYLGEQLVAVDAVNAPADYAVVKRILTSGGGIPRESASDLGASLRSLASAPAGVRA